MAVEQKRYPTLMDRIVAEFQEPRSLEDAEQRLLAVVADAENIQKQLGSRDVRDPVTGVRLSDVEFWQWRPRAIAALNAKRAEQRLLRKWVVEHPGLKQRNEFVPESVEVELAVIGQELALLTKRLGTANRRVAEERQQRARM